MKKILYTLLIILALVLGPVTGVLFGRSISGGRVAYWSQTLAWDTSPDPLVTGYNIYCGSVPGQYEAVIFVPVPQTSLSMHFNSGQRNFYAATCVNAYFLESLRSEEVSALPYPHAAGGGSPVDSSGSF